MEKAVSIISLNIAFTISAIDDFSNTMNNLEKSTQDAFGAIDKIGKGAVIAGAAIATGLGFAVKTSMDFEAQISRVGAIAEATDTELKALRQSALDLGASTSKSAVEVALGQESLAALGFTANEVISAMPGVISAAEASGADMAQTAEVMASTLNIFAMEASNATKVADILAKTANMSAADITDMQHALKYAGPPAAALGISLEELSASIGIMTNAGLKGENAGVSLRSALLSLLNPSKKNSELMETMGIAVTDAKGNFVGLSGLIENITTSMEGMTDTQKAANLASIVGTESVSGMLALMAAGPAEIDKMSESLRNSAGASAEAAAKMKDNLKGAVEEMSGAFETLMITIGTALTPAIRFLAEQFTRLVNLFNGLPSNVQSTIAIVAALTAVFLLLVGPLLILVAMIPAITTGFAAIATVFGVTAGVLASTIAVVLGVIAVIAALGVAFYIAYQKVEWFRDMVDAAWAWIKNAFKKALDFIMGIVRAVMADIAAFMNEKLTDIRAFWDKNGAQIMELVRNYFTIIGAYIQVAMGYIKGIFQAVWPIISGIIKIAWNLIKLTIDNAIDWILGIINVGLALLRGDWQGAWTAIKDLAKKIWGNIEQFFENVDLFQIGKDIIQGLIDGFGSMMGGIKKAVNKIAGLIPSGVKNFLGIHSPSRVMMELGNDTGAGFIKGIGQMVGGVAKVSESMASQPMNRAQSASNAGTVTHNSPTITLNYNGSGSESDAYKMIDIVEQELERRYRGELRVEGWKA
ncbi:MAG: phage tail tape measure protein [Bacillota bacterium]